MPEPNFAPPAAVEPPIADEAVFDERDLLAEEILYLREAIYKLARNGVNEQVLKEMAELRHQVDSLCRALKTERDLGLSPEEEEEALHRSAAEAVLAKEEADLAAQEARR